jgi:hypothetical protein
LATLIIVIFLGRLPVLRFDVHSLCYLCKLFSKVVTYLVSYVKPNLLRATQFVADGRKTFVTLLKIQTDIRVTLFISHKDELSFILY